MTFRLLHTMIRVRDLDASVAFYTKLLCMRLLRRMDFPEGRFTLAFVGYGDESDHAVLEGGSTTIAFVEDPDGYDIELVERS